ncbi:MAG TPA: hypothetical protein VNH11_09330 [Pirellulales bacterium]|nr:hypothetical protein [Pirellulales bacterium]
MSQVELPSANTGSRPKQVSRRLRRLVATHLALACAPVAFCLLPADIRFLPLMWALGSVTVGQIMLLSFWAGMGLGRTRGRLGISLLGCTYLAIWPALGSALSGPATETISIAHYLSEFSTCLVGVFTLVLVMTSAFLVVRRWFSELRSVAGDEGSSPGRVQYSILNLLVVTTVVALLLGLTRSGSPSAGSDWRNVAASTLMAVCIVIDALCAVWAALGIGGVRWRLFLVFLVASLLGLLEAIVGGAGAVAWWLVPSWILISLLPIAIVVASLLVVRSCGYRLVPKLTKAE